MEKKQYVYSTIDEVAEALGCSKSTVYSLVRQRKISHTRILGRIYLELDRVKREVRSYQIDAQVSDEPVIVLTRKEHKLLMRKIYQLTFENEKLKEQVKRD